MLHELYTYDDNVYYTLYDNSSFGIFFDSQRFLGFIEIPNVEDMDILTFKNELKDVLNCLDNKHIEYVIKFGIVSYYS